MIAEENSEANGGVERTHACPIILRTVESADTMMADWAKLPYDVLGRNSSRIAAEGIKHNYLSDLKGRCSMPWPCK